jgi:hypothetical protein
MLTSAGISGPTHRPSGSGRGARRDGRQVLSAIRAVGVESSILASDMGAAPIGIPADGFVAFVTSLRELGMTDAELDRAGRKNPRRTARTAITFPQPVRIRGL